MKTLISTRFYEGLRNARNNRSAISLEDLNDGYLDFIDNLIELSSSDRPLSSIIRCIEFTLAELFQIKDYLIKTKFPSTDIYIPFIDKATLMLEKELKLINTSLRYPHIQGTQGTYKSPLYLASGYTQTDIIELLNPMQIKGVFVRADGTKAPLELVANVFGIAMNTDFCNVDQKKWSATNRKINPTKFIDSLKETLLNESLK